MWSSIKIPLDSKKVFLLEIQQKLEQITSRFRNWNQESPLFQSCAFEVSDSKMKQIDIVVNLTVDVMGILTISQCYQNICVLLYKDKIMRIYRVS